MLFSDDLRRIYKESLLYHYSTMWAEYSGLPRGIKCRAQATRTLCTHTASVQSWDPVHTHSISVELGPCAHTQHQCRAGTLCTHTASVWSWDPVHTHSISAELGPCAHTDHQCGAGTLCTHTDHQCGAGTLCTHTASVWSWDPVHTHSISAELGLDSTNHDVSVWTF